MDIKTLKYFICIVEEGNISKAAKKLYMSQPPLSNQMKNLETELGVCLFERGSTCIELTEEGKFLYEKAKNIVQYSDLIKSEIIDKNNFPKGKIKIGLVSSVSDSIIKNVITPFYQKYQNDFEIFEGNTYSLIEKIRNGLIDCAIVRTPFISNELEVLKIKEEKLILISKEPIQKESLNEKGIIVYRRWKEVVSEELEKKDIPYFYTMMNDDARTTISLVENDLGIGIVPESILENLGNEFYKDENILSLTSSICLVYRNSTINIGLNKLIESIKNKEF